MNRRDGSRTAAAQTHSVGPRQLETVAGKNCWPGKTGGRYRTVRACLYARICHMKRTTLFVEESVDHELHALARRKGVPVSALVRESLARYVTEQRRSQTFSLQFLGRGHSGRTDVAERHEELLWRDLDPPESKSKRRSRG
jgi:hypothetical protein